MTQPVTEVTADAGARASCIVVGYSAKPEGRAALRRAIDEARLRHCALVVVPTDSQFDLAELGQELAATGVPHRIVDSAEAGDPADEVLRAAEAASVELIVIGLRRRSPVGKLLLGSNAQRVLLDASCPVLAVKADPEA
jgi:nucleotide-binding universal stress UspA family protein